MFSVRLVEQTNDMIDKRVNTLEAALDGLSDGASIMINGFGGTGVPFVLIRALEGMTVRDLTLILNGVRFVDGFAPDIFARKRVSKVIVSAARSRGLDTSTYERQWLEGTLEVEMVPQGTFAERMRAGGAGIPGFFTPTGAGTALSAGKEERVFDGKRCILETGLTADFALIRAARVDRWGNLRFRGTQGNFALSMAMAARTTVVETSDELDAFISPEDVHVPGIFVDRVYHCEDMSPVNAGNL